MFFFLVWKTTWSSLVYWCIGTVDGGIIPWAQRHTWAWWISPHHQHHIISRYPPVWIIIISATWFFGSIFFLGGHAWGWFSLDFHTTFDAGHQPVIQRSRLALMTRRTPNFFGQINQELRPEQNHFEEILRHEFLVKPKKTRWWQLNIFFYLHYVGKWSILTNIFQMGRNHQLENMQGPHVFQQIFLFFFVCFFKVLSSSKFLEGRDRRKISSLFPNFCFLASSPSCWGLHVFLENTLVLFLLVP